MARPHRAVLAATMSLALLFGFFHLVVSDSQYNFERLHVFLFNLCSGGAVLLYFTAGRNEVGPTVLVYFALSLLYAVSAFLRWYGVTLTLSVPLLLLVEWTRIKRFSLLPVDFFRQTVSVGQKFHQAAVLCLSLAIVFAVMAFNFLGYGLLAILNPRAAEEGRGEST